MKYLSVFVYLPKGTSMNKEDLVMLDFTNAYMSILYKLTGELWTGNKSQKGSDISFWSTTTICESVLEEH